jgi:hypothetical protein
MDASEHNRRIISELIQNHGGVVMPFSQLPDAAQFSMAYYMSVNGEAWELPAEVEEAYFNCSQQWQARSLEAIGRGETAIDEHDAIYRPAREAFMAALPFFLKKYGERKFGLVTVPIAALIVAHLQLYRDDDDFPGDFDSYHKWFLVHCGTEDHGVSVWPVILDSTGDALLQDGWHRFHSYVERKLEQIPCLYCPRRANGGQG